MTRPARAPGGVPCPATSTVPSTRTSAPRCASSSSARSSRAPSRCSRSSRSTVTSGRRPAPRGCSASTSPRSSGAWAPTTTASTPSRPRSSTASTPPSGSCFGIHSDVCPPYIVDLGTQEQKERWLPAMAAGEKICAIAMTEPGGGSDLAALKTTAVRDGDALGAQRQQDLHHQRLPGRPRHRRHPHRPEQGRQGHHPVHGRGRHGGLHPRPQARQGRPGGERHRRAVLPGRARARQQPDRRRGHGLRRDDAAPARRSASAPPAPTSPTPSRSSSRPSSTPRSARPSASRSAPSSTTSSSSPSWSPRSRSPRPTSTTASRRTPRARCPRSTRPRPSGGAPRCRTTCSTSASSCTAATAS